MSIFAIAFIVCNQILFIPMKQVQNVEVPTIHSGMTVSELSLALEDSTPIHSKQLPEFEDKELEKVAQEMLQLERDLDQPLSHQFTVKSQEGIKTCFSAQILEPVAEYYFIFDSGRLAEIIHPPSFESVVKDMGDGIVIRERAPVQAFHRLEKVIDTDRITIENFEDSVRKQVAKARRARENHEQPNGLLMSGLTSDQWIQMAQTNKEMLRRRASLRDRFDSLQIRLGMSEDDVTELLQQDPVTRREKHGKDVLIFGSMDYPDLSPWISVYFENHKVVAVFSRDFFNVDLLPKGIDLQQQP